MSTNTATTETDYSTKTYGEGAVYLSADWYSRTTLLSLIKYIDNMNAANKKSGRPIK